MVEARRVASAVLPVRLVAVPASASRRAPLVPRLRRVGARLRPHSGVRPMTARRYCKSCRDELAGGICLRCSDHAARVTSWRRKLNRWRKKLDAQPPAELGPFVVRGKVMRFVDPALPDDPEPAGVIELLGRLVPHAEKLSRRTESTTTPIVTNLTESPNRGGRSGDGLWRFGCWCRSRFRSTGR